MKIVNHWLQEVQHLISPNSDARPDPDDIRLIVVHCISLPPEQFGGPYINQLFCNQLNADEHPYFSEIADLTVSAHLLIRREGEIIQFVGFDQRAWHAGLSIFQGRERCNDFSIGIELEGSVNQGYTEVQYQLLSQVILELLQYYPELSSENIVGHCDIAPERKADPGPHFDWGKLQTLLSN